MISHVPDWDFAATYHRDPVINGDRWVFEFVNGYGASVIRNRISYGGEVGLFEMAVLGADGRITYDTPITEDVVGWLTEAAVNAHLHRIAALPQAT